MGIRSLKNYALVFAVLAVRSGPAIAQYTFSTLASFDGKNGGSTNGAGPYSGLTTDASGNLYGTAFGGANGLGTIFEVVKGSGTITTLSNFNGTNGETPNGGLIADANGNLYGTTEAGGANGDGTIFELSKGSNTITTLASFSTSNGSIPEGGLVFDTAGNLYGTTNKGGANGFGTIFELVSGSSTPTALASFSGVNGKYPFDAPVIDSFGNLYGTTRSGGANGAGTIFELPSGSNGIATLTSFDDTFGGGSLGGLVMDSSGNLYGTNDGGGAAPPSGAIFELAKGSSVVSVLANFTGSNGSHPTGSLVDINGNLFGTTEQGGDSNHGTVFELASGSGTITTLESFDGSLGDDPQPGLTADTSGNLYGMTEFDDYDNSIVYGSIFELSPVPEPSFALISMICFGIRVRRVQ